MLLQPFKKITLGDVVEIISTLQEAMFEEIITGDGLQIVVCTKDEELYVMLSILKESIKEQNGGEQK